MLPQLSYDTRSCMLHSRGSHLASMGQLDKSSLVFPPFVFIQVPPKMKLLIQTYSGFAYTTFFKKKYGFPYTVLLHNKFTLGFGHLRYHLDSTVLQTRSRLQASTLTLLSNMTETKPISFQDLK